MCYFMRSATAYPDLAAGEALKLQNAGKLDHGFGALSEFSQSRPAKEIE